MIMYQIANMPDYRTNLINYSESLEKFKEKVDNAGFQQIKADFIDILSKQTDMHPDIFQGVMESFFFIENGYVRTGIFVLGRTVEEIMTLLIETCHSKNKTIGITLHKYNRFKKDFSFSKKIQFLAGEEIQLNQKGFPSMNCTLIRRRPFIPPARKVSLHKLREFGRNSSAHPATALELQIIENNIINWVENGIGFIIDTQVDINFL